MFLLGAGASVDSGHLTYRGPTGQYTDNEGCNSDDPLINPLHVSALNDKTRFNLMWETLYDICVDKKLELGPTYKRIEMLCKESDNALIVTQNVDGLIHLIGNDPTIVELHGSADTVSCLKCCKRFAWGEKYCTKDCGGLLRPNILLFGEELPEIRMRIVNTFIKRKKPTICYVIGTSMQFSYLHKIILRASSRGSRIIHVNPNPEYMHDKYLQVQKQNPPRILWKKRKNPHERMDVDDFLHIE